MENQKIKSLDEFKGWFTHGIWVIMLDGKPMRGYNQNAFDTKAGASSSLSHALRYDCKNYGFKTAKEMREALTKEGRLEIVNLQEVLYGTDSE